MGLTEKRVRDARGGDAPRIEWDDEVKGLGLRVMPSGVKSFVLQYRADGVSRRATLGRASELSLAAARRKASEMLQSARSGRDPLLEQRARRELPSVSKALDRFRVEHMERRLEIGRMAPRTVQEYSRQIERLLRPALGKKKVQDVTRQDLERILRPLPPVMANRVRALASSFFSWCERADLRPQNANPAKGIEKAVEEARDRTLSADELSRLGKALEGLDGNPGAILAIRLAALTGLRIGEVRAMRWADVDMASGAVVLPKTKTGRRTHTLPSAALVLLAAAAKLGECVIPGRDPDRPLDYRSIQRHFANACRSAGIDGARLHDLRRTLMTDAAATGVGAYLLRDMVGHKTTAMADRYIRQAGEPLVELRERAGAAMAAKLAGTDSGAVVSFERGRK